MIVLKILINKNTIGTYVCILNTVCNRRAIVLLQFRIVVRKGYGKYNSLAAFYFSVVDSTNEVVLINDFSELNWQNHCCIIVKVQVCTV